MLPSRYWKKRQLRQSRQLLTISRGCNSIKKDRHLRSFIIPLDVDDSFDDDSRFDVATNNNSPLLRSFVEKLLFFFVLEDT